MYNAKINESFYISSAKLEIISKQFTKSNNFGSADEQRNVYIQKKSTKR